LRFLLPFRLLLFLGDPEPFCLGGSFGL